MKRNIFIFHGTNSGPDENWFPWLKNKLEILGHKVYIPQFPHSDDPDTYNELAAWFKTLEPFKKFINQDSIIFGHSKGAVFCYHVLQTLNLKLHAVCLVAPWYAYHWYQTGKQISSFHVEPFRWDTLRNKAKYFQVYQSTNDVIEVWQGEKIARDVGEKAFIVENAGHFNTESGYTTFELLLSNLQKIL